MNGAPRVSVIIPCFNSSPWIAETIESVLAQTFRDREVIVVDDGSTDGTGAILRRYGARIVHVSQSNCGAGAARNTGLRVARGEFIAFLDGDDKWHPDKLDAQVRVLDSHPEVGIVFTDYAPFGDPADDETGLRRGIFARIARRAVGPDVFILTADSIFPDLLEDLFPWVNTLLVRRRCLEEAGFFFDEDLLYGADFQMTVRLSAGRHRFACVDRCLAYRRERQGSLSKLGRDLGDYIASLERLPSYVPLSSRHREWVRTALARAYMSAGYEDFVQYRLEAARRRFRASVACKPSPRALLYYLSTHLPPAMLMGLRDVKQRVGAALEGRP